MKPRAIVAETKVVSLPPPPPPPPHTHKCTPGPLNAWTPAILHSLTSLFG